jgi:putative ABC transport system permease protein
MIGETFLQIFIGLVIALFIIQFTLPIFNQFAGKDINLLDITEIPFLGFFIAFLASIALIAGVYPALVISRIKPGWLIRENAFRGGGTAKLRKMFIVLQFALSILLIIITLFVARQISYMKNKDLGLEIPDRIVLNLANTEYQSKHNILRAEIEKIPEIETVSSSSTIPGKFIGSNAFNIQGNESVHFLFMYYIDENFIPVNGLKLLKGRNFSTEIGTDKKSAIIINEATIKTMSLGKPIGAIIKDQSDNSIYTVIGVINDFHSESLRMKIKPLIIRYVPDKPNRTYKQVNYLTMAFNSGSDFRVISNVKEIYNTIIPNQPFEYFFIDDLFGSFYLEEERFQRIFLVSATLAIFLSCLGLFGLTTFLMQRRIKEIGIRKVLGASCTNIVTGMVKNYAIWIIAANIIGWPLAYYYVKNWLTNFEYRTEISLLVFIISAVLTFVIAILTASYSAFKVARTNPIDAFRNE